MAAYIDQSVWIKQMKTCETVAGCSKIAVLIFTSH